MTFFEKILYGICYSLFWLLSLLPLSILYLLSDCSYFWLYRVFKYRRRIVWRNLKMSFPEKSKAELQTIESRFYRWLCDYFVETVKLTTMSKAEMHRRMKFPGIEQLVESVKAGHSAALMLGHYCNWEWVSSIPSHVPLDLHIIGAQIYHPLENKIFDRIFHRIRGRFGAVSITKDDTFPTLLKWRKEGKTCYVGFIADQVPGYSNMHYWPTFLNHPLTPVFTGAERISRLFDYTVYYIDLHRPRRGYYVGTFIKLTETPAQIEKFQITEQYIRMLETSIRRNPPYWLWSHNRWKRTREQFDALFSEQERQRILSKL